MKLNYPLRLLATLISCITVSASQNLEEFGITVHGTDRQFCYTNKQAGTFYGETGKQNAGGWQGWFVNAEKIFHDYSLIAGEQLDRSSAEVVVFPHQLVRSYTNGTEETFTFLDSVNSFTVEVTSGRFSTLPLAVEFSLPETFRYVKNNAHTIFFNKKISSGDTAFVPSWIAFGADDATVDSTMLTVRPGFAHRSLIAGAAGRTLEETERLIQFVLRHADSLKNSRKKRLERIVERSPLVTNDRDVNRAVGWARLSMDALIMNQATSGKPTKGIFAGLPWFNNYWGRDSFISLPGATYVTGNFDDAKDILRSFARFQESDSSSSNYGRIPNIATTTSIAYNTADGTPWFVKSMYEYVKYSNDTAFLREMYPVVKRSIEGTMRYHTDSLGFLTHGDAESWMDAVGGKGPWSPRGNRACDIQAFWHAQLSVGMFCAEYFQDYYTAAEWKKLADRLEKNFNGYFVDQNKKIVYDHLKNDGTPSAEMRPNQIFCIDAVGNEDVRQNIVRTVLHELVYEHGTSTLAQSDGNFHPYHHYESAYVQDAAYHNGIVWTWLNGQVNYASTRYDLQDLVYPVTENSIHQILDRGCAGTLSELLDAHPRRGEPEARLSGTFSQAWSLAEFIRSFYQDYFGVSVDATAHTLRINPKLPRSITSADFTVGSGEGNFAVRYRRSADSVRISVLPMNIHHPTAIQYLWVYDNGNAVLAPVEVQPDSNLEIIHTEASIKVLQNDRILFTSTNDARIFLKNFSDKKHFAGTTLAHPETAREFPSLRGPSFPLLTLNDVRQANASAKILFDSDDGTGDDTGINQKYRYPENVHFKKGILDITHATVRFDKNSAYFTLKFANLSDPGWHPEYGFQLTLAAIALHRSESDRGTEVGCNSNFTLSPERSFSRLIVVGGGIQVLNEESAVLCEYHPLPDDSAAPIGNVMNRTIEFSIPLKYLGVPDKKWSMTILVGAQDDHGGAGIGEFRSVNEKESEWAGGGKKDPRMPNVYDVMMLEQTNAVR